MRRLSRALSIALAAAIVLPGGCTVVRQDVREPVLPQPQAASEFEARCVRVIDGDTIELDDGEHVRYIGMDTPEMRPVEPWAEAATEANRELVEGEMLRLETDVQLRDRYGRLLAYVYVGDLFVNERLVRDGYAHAVSYPPNVAHQEELVAAQREAREADRGLWGDESQQQPKAAHGRPPDANE